jgi:hypothetical protein
MGLFGDLEPLEPEGFDDEGDDFDDDYRYGYGYGYGYGRRSFALRVAAAVAILVVGFAAAAYVATAGKTPTARSNKVATVTPATRARATTVPATVAPAAPSSDQTSNRLVSTPRYRMYATTGGGASAPVTVAAPSPTTIATAATTPATAASATTTPTTAAPATTTPSTAAPATTSTTAPPVKIVEWLASLDPPTALARAGDDVRVQLRVKNLSDHKIFYVYDHDSCDPYLVPDPAVVCTSGDRSLAVGVGKSQTVRVTIHSTYANSGRYEVAIGDQIAVITIA